MYKIQVWTEEFHDLDSNKLRIFCPRVKNQKQFL